MESSEKNSEPQPTVKLSKYEAGAAIMNGCLGTTILYISHIFANVHYNIISFSIIAIVTFVITGTYIILAACKIHYNAKEYYELVEKALHPYVEYFTMIYAAVYVFETCVAYLIIIKEQLKQSIEELFTNSHSKNNSHINVDNLVLFVLIVFMIPPLISRNVWFMAYSSLINLISAVYIMLFLFLEYIKKVYIYKNECKMEGENQAFQLDLGYIFYYEPTDKFLFFISYFKTLISSISAVIFGYRNHIPSVSIFEAMSEQTLSNFIHVSIASVLFSTSVYSISGYFGYATFCDSTKIDILLNHNSVSIVLVCTRLAAASILATSYIMSAFSSRIALHKVLDWAVVYITQNKKSPNTKTQEKYLNKRGESQPNTYNGLAEHLNTSIPHYSALSWACSGFIWFFVTYFVSGKFKNGDPIITLLGGSSCYFSLIIPGVCLISLINHLKTDYNYATSLMLTTMGYGYATLGALILCCSIISAFSLH